MNGARQRSRLALDRHLALLHRLEQRRLGLRWGAVDLVGEQDVGEDRARAGTRTRSLRWSKIDEPVTSEGNRSGVNWMRGSRATSPVRTTGRSSSSRARDSPRAARGRRRAARAAPARARRACRRSRARPRRARGLRAHEGRRAPSAAAPASTRHRADAASRCRGRCGRAARGRVRANRSAASSPSSAFAASARRARSTLWPAERCAAAASRRIGSRRWCRCAALETPRVISRSVRTSSGGRERSTGADSERGVETRLRRELGCAARDARQGCESDRCENENVGGEDLVGRDRTDAEHHRPASTVAPAAVVAIRERSLFMRSPPRRGVANSSRTAMSASDRAAAHLRLRLMLAELCPFEQVGAQTPRALGARVELSERPLDVLERRLGLCRPR